MAIDPRPSDLTIDEGRYVRLPVKAILGLFVVCAGAVWSYADLRADMNQTKRAAEVTATTVAEDHRTLMLVIAGVSFVAAIADESKRMYNRYFRDYNDPDRKR